MSASRVTTVFAVALLLWHGPLTSHAQQESAGTIHARSARLQGLSPTELLLLDPFLDAGPVALVEFANVQADELPAVHVAVRVNAPLETLLQVASRPERYHEFLGILDSTKILSRSGSTTVYSWELHLSLLRLEGRNQLRVYRGNAERGHRIGIDNLQGDFGTGRTVLRLLPDGPHGSLLVISLRLDLRTANYVARQAAKAGRSVNRSANLCVAYALALGLAKQTEAQANLPPPSPRPFPSRGLPVTTATLLPLLARGDLVWMTLQNGQLQNSGVLGRIHQPHTLVRQAMTDAQGFGSSLVPGSRAEIVKTEPGHTLFDWEIPIPLVGVSGRMEMRAQAPTVQIRAVDGALTGGQWNFDLESLAPSLTVVRNRAELDIRKTNGLIRAMIGADPHLIHGVSASSQVLLIRALRARTTKLAEPPRKAQ